MRTCALLIRRMMQVPTINANTIAKTMMGVVKLLEDVETETD